MKIPRSRPDHAARCRGRRGKVRYRNHEDATRALSTLRRTGSSNIPQRAYRCPACQGWHLTSMVHVTRWAGEPQVPQPA
jgi:hypothetical protein